MDKKILIVDTDHQYRSILANAYKNLGFSIYATGNIDEATAWAQINSIDIAVIDCISENDDSGLVLAYRLRKFFSKLPIIIVTSMSEYTGIYFNPDSERERKWLNADVYLSKDNSIDGVMRETFRLLRLKK